ncbi:unnamed protein product [Soboliphyme baturini]|uniref:Transposase n=1 Tax=Soboliphyme baturini TaxID=241478 RepID=A0A183IZ83_9BILA|nr:unnamed protein product [Soboliphyme baturini]
MFANEGDGHPIGGTSSEADELVLARTLPLGWFDAYVESRRRGGIALRHGTARSSVCTTKYSEEQTWQRTQMANRCKTEHPPKGCISGDSFHQPLRHSAKRFSHPALGCITWVMRTPLGLEYFAHCRIDRPG